MYNPGILDTMYVLNKVLGLLDSGHIVFGCIGPLKHWVLETRKPWESWTILEFWTP